MAGRNALGGTTVERATKAAAQAGSDAAPLPASDADWPLADRPGYLIRRLHQAHGALFQSLCGGFGVTPVQYSLLSALGARGRADQTAIAADVGLDRSTTAATLARLEARGMISRARSEGDRRAVLCGLTPAGRGLLRRIEPLARQAHSRTLAALSDREAATLMTLLRRALG